MAAYCLLHGDWHDGFCWAPVLADLRRRGHDAIAPDLPFDDPSAGFEARVQPALAALDAVSSPVIVVGHSASSGYAAVVADRTPGSLLVHLRPRLGPFPPPVGAPEAFARTSRFPPRTWRASWSGRQRQRSTRCIRACHSRPRGLAERLRPGAPPAEYPLAGHPDVPTVLIYTADDEIFEPGWERFMARELLGIEPIEIPGGTSRWLRTRSGWPAYSISWRSSTNPGVDSAEEDTEARHPLP